MLAHLQTGRFITPVQSYLQNILLLKTGWFWITVPALIAAVVAPIILHFSGPEKAPKPLIITVGEFADMRPMKNSHIAAAVLQFSSSLSWDSVREPSIKLAYNREGGRFVS